MGGVNTGERAKTCNPCTFAGGRCCDESDGSLCPYSMHHRKCPLVAGILFRQVEQPAFRRKPLGGRDRVSAARAKRLALMPASVQASLYLATEM